MSKKDDEIIVGPMERPANLVANSAGVRPPPPAPKPPASPEGKGKEK